MSRASGADSPRVGASRGLDGASHSWPFGCKKRRPFGESNPARITLQHQTCDQIIRETGDSAREVRSTRRRTEPHRVDGARASRAARSAAPAAARHFWAALPLWRPSAPLLRLPSPAVVAAMNVGLPFATDNRTPSRRKTTWQHLIRRRDAYPCASARCARRTAMRRPQSCIHE